MEWHNIALGKDCQWPFSGHTNAWGEQQMRRSFSTNKFRLRWSLPLQSTRMTNLVRDSSKLQFLNLSFCSTVRHLLQFPILRFKEAFNFPIRISIMRLYWWMRMSLLTNESTTTGFRNQWLPTCFDSRWIA